MFGSFMLHYSAGNKRLIKTQFLVWFSWEYLLIASLPNTKLGDSFNVMFTSY